ncbi:2,3-bisphosphoglycerate-independent phosphoglycerate mutase [Lyticum sinuosum]|uniref:2,3-bisphosphoglycerate-independent phosphoglycerate mutase n=1 Tax=Lyticum sinuosum TaxID=1332059 RepID=A0AAE5AHK9_9RICK|nr:2,3-bisphosphoglycerate-independent phosphoglycerate mutase [Lyticum sinuosum]MDZ5761146.1 2,3-bisphosphoglycerate-independent phosphoglycerate mutase [Lyticum sinuosum]
MSIILCIWDGWGKSLLKKNYHNAIELANTPYYDEMIKNCPHSYIGASGCHVGLSDGQMGNSEVGHMTIGAGRIILQKLPKINSLIENGNFFELPNFKLLLNRLINESTLSKSNNLFFNKKVLHIIAIMSDGGVHGHINHIIKIASFLSQNNIKIELHLFSDGRDTSPASAIEYALKIEELCYNNHNITIASIMGRYYGMDRDNRHDRTQKAFETISYGNINYSTNHQYTFEKITDYIKNSYNSGIYDEFIIPAARINYNGINKEEDLILCLNYRSDRIRQLLYALINHLGSNNIYTISDTGIDSINSNIILFPEVITDNLGKKISDLGLKQLRIAETEKYAHVTFFLNGGNENPYPNEDRILIPSPKIPYYDMQPEMSAEEITYTLIREMKSKKYHFICVNYANADMVGHTGNLDASIKACEILDKQLGKILKECNNSNYQLILTSDHGNIEEMFNYIENTKCTAHTSNNVPVIYYDNYFYRINQKNTEEYTDENFYDKKNIKIYKNIFNKYFIKNPSSGLSDIAKFIIEIINIKYEL